MTSVANRIPAYIILILTILTLSYIVLMYKPTAVKRFPSPYAPVGDVIVGPESASFLWSYRWLDILVLSLLLLVSAASCIALLRRS
ncbi:MAG: hypothetical protein RMJ00_02510 [Nitrososphaerota archaeon]|nr:hypothetical protein [Candidatus Bathyarchaeota archaeon]MDW8061553.1 hypothetical protein [Nitrososphaerota archaeon]